MLRFITDLNKRRNEKSNLDKFSPFSKINQVKILWLQANQQTLEKWQNFTDLKNILHLEKDKMHRITPCRELVQKQQPVFCKKRCSYKIRKFTGIHLCQSLFFNKVGLKP